MVNIARRVGGQIGGQPQNQKDGVTGVGDIIKWGNGIIKVDGIGSTVSSRLAVLDPRVRVEDIICVDGIGSTV